MVPTQPAPALESTLDSSLSPSSIEQEPFLSYEHVHTSGNSTSAFERLKQFFSLPVFFAVSGCLLISVIFVVDHARFSKSSVLSKPCGSTAAEARKAGCTFDIMSFCWLPPPCYDAELSEEFASLQNWTWSQDQEQTKMLAAEEALSGNYEDLWVDMEYHLWHCTYMWRKMHRALLSDSGYARIDSYIANINHTVHCEKMLLTGRNETIKNVNTIIRTKYPDCGLPDR